MDRCHPGGPQAEEEQPVTEQERRLALEQARIIDQRLTAWNAARRDGPEPCRWTVVQVGLDGLSYLMAPGFFTNRLAIVWEGGTHAEAAKRMGEGYDIYKAVYGEEAAKIFWHGQRLILVGTTGNRWEDFPT
jgi:hypothetical protein